MIGPGLLLSGGLRVSAARTPSKVALICAQQRRTYAELLGRVNRVGARLAALGFRPGDRAIVLAPNCIEYPELICGVADAGGVVATLSARSATAEVTAAANDCGARVLFVHEANLGTVDRSALPLVEHVIVLGEEYEAWLRAADPAFTPMLSAAGAPVAETDPFTLVYTSGTTGRPKGILISHRSRTLTFHAMAMEYGCYGPDDLQLGIAPMAHGAGFAFIMCSVYFGGTVEILPKFDAELVVGKLAEGEFTGVFMVPTHYSSIFGLGPGVLERHRGKARALRTIMSNAAALPQVLKEKIVGYWGPGLLHETYGSTEAGIVTNLRPQYQLEKPRCVGLPFALNEVRLLDQAGRDVAEGEVGELYSRSPYLFNGYYNQPEETAAVWRDGWLTAGDLARRDADGHYYIVDRRKDMVVSGGLNVYPREIEEVLQAHPAVHEAAVIGVPDEHWGERLCAYFVLRRERHAGSDELEAWCRERLAGYKVPKEFRALAELPRNAGGKVLKKELRQLS
ncbi:MAG TPA: class I adenylate-forming enzyme family protein [Steroidobacteraceae bacterium]|nr:class I adenylate-forming enzyme family protein [Steroidobacteraceae bacterium]HNS28737.1 class I adenylate-forming enzyme family protein [Steroidobacteraceae bacterium]